MTVVLQTVQAPVHDRFDWITLIANIVIAFAAVGGLVISILAARAARIETKVARAETSEARAHLSGAQQLIRLQGFLPQLEQLQTRWRGMGTEMQTPTYGMRTLEAGQHLLAVAPTEYLPLLREWVTAYEVAAADDDWPAKLPTPRLEEVGAEIDTTVTMLKEKIANMLADPQTAAAASINPYG